VKVLFVTPVLEGTGETVTSLHMAIQLARDGHEVTFLASDVAVSLLAPRFGRAVITLGSQLADNERTFQALAADLRPDVIVFADWPLLFFPRGVAPLLRASRRLEGLEDIDACLVTLDHFGFTRLSSSIFMGPAHLTLHQQTFPPPPPGMQRMLPCPMHSPREGRGLDGTAFRYWDLPLSIPNTVRQSVREYWLADKQEVLIFHSVAAWSWRGAEMLGLPLYRFLPRILEYYLSDVSRPVTVVSVNNGSLLAAPKDGLIRFINLISLPTREFEALLFSSDLVLTENRLSISLGKAVCGLQPCGVMKNSHRLLQLVEQTSGPIRDIIQEMESIKLGSVYAHDVFPTGMRDVIDQIGIYHKNPLAEAFAELELYGGELTRQRFQALINDSATREALRIQQSEYVKEVNALPTGTEVLTRMLEEYRSQR
jgi:hypothetical protein